MPRRRRPDSSSGRCSHSECSRSKYRQELTLESLQPYVVEPAILTLTQVRWQKEQPIRLPGYRPYQVRWQKEQAGRWAQWKEQREGAWWRSQAQAQQAWGRKRQQQQQSQQQSQRQQQHKRQRPAAGAAAAAGDTSAWAKLPPGEARLYLL